LACTIKVLQQRSLAGTPLGSMKVWWNTYIKSHFYYSRLCQNDKGPLWSLKENHLAIHSYLDVGEKKKRNRTPTF
jgi:hypothetical protein